MPQAAYNSAYNATTFPCDVARTYVRIFDTSKTFTPIGSTTPVTIPFQPKAIHDEMGAAYDTEYGRMSGMLGLELLDTNNLTQNIMLYGYASPPVDIMQDSMTPIGTLGDGTQIWKITHNGVDTHPIHFHLFNVQLINRVAWDGALLPPEPNELGWKETVRVNPLEDTIVAMRPVAPTQPFDIPNSVRLIDPTMPEGAPLMAPPGGFVDPTARTVSTVLNHYVNFGWEYVWHCHILSHEEMDMMHALAFAVAPKAPSNLMAVATGTGAGRQVNLTWTDNSLNETGFTIQRADRCRLHDRTDDLLGRSERDDLHRSHRQHEPDVLLPGVRHQRGRRHRGLCRSLGRLPHEVCRLGTLQRSAVNAVSPPAAPTNLVATARSQTQVNLTWRDNATNETGFVIERADNGGAFVQIAAPGPRNNTGNVNYTDTAVTAGNTYAYQVKAVRGVASSAYSNVATVTAPTLVVAAPTNLAATLQPGPAVALTWRDNATNETGFVVERADNGGAFIQIAIPGRRNNTGNVTYTDPTVTAGNTYVYRVKAVNGTVSSAYSNAATVTTPALALNSPSNLTRSAQGGNGNNQWMIIAWNDNSNNE